MSLLAPLQFKVLLALVLVCPAPVFTGVTHPDDGLTISGNRSLPASVLEQRLRQKGVDLDELLTGAAAARERAARIVQVFYQSKGFPLARVVFEARDQSLSLRVVEGPRAELGEVRFQGNLALVATQLRRAARFKGTLSASQLEAGLSRVRELYRESGYREVELGPVAVEVIEAPTRDHFPIPFRVVNRTRIRVTVPILEGPRFRFGRTVAHPLCPKAGYPKPGDVYRPSVLQTLRDGLQRCFFARGLMLQDLQVTENLGEQPDQIDVQVHARVLPPLEIARIEFQGNRRFPDGFYRRELVFSERDLLDPRLLETSLRNLKAMGVLERLDRSDVELVRRNPQEVDVTISLHERKPRKVEFSLSPDGLGGLDLSLAYSVLNLIGLGEKLGLDLRVGSHSSEAAIGIASRYLFGTQIPAALALRFFRRNTAFRLPGVEEPLARLLERDSWGFEGGGSYRISSRQRARLTYGFEKTRKPQPSHHFNLSPSWIFSWRQGVTGTTLEVGQKLSLFAAAEPFGSLRHDIVVARARDRERLDVQTTDFRLHFSYAGFFSRAEPLFDRLFPDAHELRSFAVTAGPWAELPGGGLQPVGGDLLWTFSSDYQLPLHPKAALVPFFDLGSNRSSNRLQPGRILPGTGNLVRVSLGTELRIRPFRKLPVARIIAAWRPLRLDTLVSASQGKARLRENPFAIKLVF